MCMEKTVEDIWMIKTPNLMVERKRNVFGPKDTMEKRNDMMPRNERKRECAKGLCADINTEWPKNKVEGKRYGVCTFGLH